MKKKNLKLKLISMAAVLSLSALAGIKQPTMAMNNEALVSRSNQLKENSEVEETKKLDEQNKNNSEQQKNDDKKDEDKKVEETNANGNNITKQKAPSYTKIVHVGIKVEYDVEKKSVKITNFK